MAKPKGSPKTGGRQKGTPNKNTAILKDAILTAAQLAGGGDEDGLVKYLQTQASANPGPFMALLGKVMPLQIAGDAENPLQTFTRIELIGVRPTDQDTR
jgi:hypothetical protein